jgi:drug/metabolite transporter (DMT)-like permease
VGFAGVLLIVRPGTEGFTVYSIYALISVLFVTLRDLTTRRLSGSVPSLTVAISAAAGVALFGAVGTATADWVPVSPRGWLLLGGASVFLVGGYIFSVMVMRVGDISVVAPFRYTSLIVALILGLVLLRRMAHAPDPPRRRGRGRNRHLHPLARASSEPSRHRPARAP